ncbi:MAG: extensin family protein [Devosia sp.]
MLKHAVLISLTLTGLALGLDVPLPRARPANLQTVAPAKVDEIGPGPTATISPIPQRTYQVACPAVLAGNVTAEALPPIHEGQCGLQSPLAVSGLSVNGRNVGLSNSVITDCGMATALREWLAEVDAYTLARARTRIETVLVSTSYECRNVNHEAAAT